MNYLLTFIVLSSVIWKNAGSVERAEFQHLGIEEQTRVKRQVCKDDPDCWDNIYPRRMYGGSSPRQKRIRYPQHYRSLSDCGLYGCPLETVMYDASIVPKECQKAKPITSDYIPKGHEYDVGDLKVYESEDTSPKRLLIAIYDIFGLSNNMKQVVDTIAEFYNFRVVMPDFFRGNVWDMDNFPPEDPSELQEWLQKWGSWDRIVKNDIEDVLDHFATNEGITEVAIFGMCWGGKVALLAATHVDGLKAAGLVHPASVNNSEAYGVKIPMYLLPSKHEPDLLPFYDVLIQKFGGNCGHRRFHDMFHGFAGARGDFSNPLNAQRVEEVIDILGGFFGYNLN